MTHVLVPAILLCQIATLYGCDVKQLALDLSMTTLLSQPFLVPGHRGCFGTAQEVRMDLSSE